MMPGEKKDKSKVLVTGDDLLIEYIERLINEIKPPVNDKDLKPEWYS